MTGSAIAANMKMCSLEVWMAWLGLVAIVKLRQIFGNCRKIVVDILSGLLSEQGELRPANRRATWPTLIHPRRHPIRIRSHIAIN